MPKPGPRPGLSGAQRTAPLAGMLPLVARAVVACPPVTRRINAVIDTVGQAWAATGPGGNPHEAARAAHRAVLHAVRIAAEGGHTDLAERWCRAHIETVAGMAGAIPAREAAALLASVIQHARLHAHQDLDGAIAALEQLVWAVRDQVPVPLAMGAERVWLPLGNIHASSGQRRALVTMVRAGLLGTATSGLAAQGHWSQAVTIARRNGGIGDRLSTGRQVLIVEQIAAGDLDAARHLIATSHLPTAWEDTIATCLTALCARPEARHAAVSTMLACYHASLDRTPPPHQEGGARFQIRQGLLAVRVAAGTGPSGDGILHRTVQEITSRLLAAAIRAEDGYVARDVLRCPAVLRGATRQQHATLLHTAGRAGLATGPLATGTRRDRLQIAVDQCLDLLRQIR